MSEFSASYHLKTSDHHAVVSLIRKSGNEGYIFPESNGWELRIFNKDDLVFEYTCDWTDDIHIEKNLFDIHLIKELIMEQGNSAEGIESLFDLDEDVFSLEEPPAYTFAKKLGLKYYEWLSADYLGRDEIDKDIIVVD